MCLYVWCYNLDAKCSMSGRKFYIEWSMKKNSNFASTEEQKIRNRSFTVRYSIVIYASIVFVWYWILFNCWAIWWEIRHSTVKEGYTFFSLFCDNKDKNIWTSFRHLFFLFFFTSKSLKRNEILSINWNIFYRSPRHESGATDIIKCITWSKKKIFWDIEQFEWDILCDDAWWYCAPKTTCTLYIWTLLQWICSTVFRCNHYV